jgi:hypothetical protein
MSARPLALVLLTIAASAVTACTDVTAPTRATSPKPSSRASHDVTDPTCKSGAWNSSTGRCE